MLQAYYKRGSLEAGCDEAGRGCLAGPVFAAAVILPEDFHHPLLNDSKQLNALQRETLRTVIESEAMAWAVAQVSHEEIDRINILKASFRAMHLAIEQLKVKPGFLLIDGNRFTPYDGINHSCIVKGDAKYASIAAASILAKTYRDDLMLKLHREFPLYGWEQNKGYPTASHRKAVMQHGISPYHRKSFNCAGEQLTLFV